MKDYTIYVTEEIAKKAIEKGCPLQKVYEQYTGQPPIYYTLPHSDPNWYQCDAYYLPTAEQICGWLRENYEYYFVISYNSLQLPAAWDCKLLAATNDTFHYISNIGNLFSSYEEALIEGINKALELI